MGGGRGDFFLILGAQIDGDDGADADAEADRHGVDEVLDRVDQREGCHRLLADFGYEKAVDDVIEGIHHH